VIDNELSIRDKTEVQMKNKERKFEEDILDSFERGEWQSVPDLKDEIARYASSAASTLTKDKRINIRISSRDLEDIQTRAAGEGMPYQALIASVLHKYVSGRLVETPLRQPTHLTGRAKKMHAG
jgi:predicted DNA binding CopG/RHH family protein